MPPDRSTETGHSRAVTAVSVGILISRALGYVRDGVIMAVFGAGAVTDAYLIAFLIPNLFRRLAAEGALSASFIPIFAGKEKTNRDEAEAFAGSTLTYIFIVVGLGVAIAAMMSPAFVSVFAPGLRKSPEIFDLTSRLLAALFPYLLMMSLYAVVSGILNTRGVFGIPAAASALENLAVIAAAFFLVPLMGERPESRIWGLVVGVLAGGVLQAGLVWVWLGRTGFRFRPSLKKSPELTEMLWLMLPFALTLAIYQLNNVVNQNIASFLAPGTITVLYLAYRLIEFPSALFGTAVGTVALPKASQASDDRQFCDVLDRSVRMCLLWMIPSMLAFLSFAQPLIVLLFQYGNFSAEDGANVAAALRVYALALPFIGLGRILSSACYAVKSPKIPLRAGLWSVGTNIVASVALVFVLPPQYKACGIAAGMALASLMNFIFLYRFSRANDLLRGFTLAGVPKQAALHLAASACFAVPLAMISPTLTNWPASTQKAAAAAAVFLSMGIYFGVLKCFGASGREVDSA